MAKLKTSISLDRRALYMLKEIAKDEDRSPPNTFERLVKERFKERFGEELYNEIMSNKKPLK